MQDDVVCRVFKLTWHLGFVSAIQLSKKHHQEILAKKSGESQGAPKSFDRKSKELEAAPPPRPQVQNYKPKKPKLDIKDFQFVGLKGEVKVKPPG